MIIRNFTPHVVVVVFDDGTRREFPSEGEARCKVTRSQLSMIGDIPVFQNLFGEVEGLPEPSEGTVYIVSFPVLQALAGKRHDLIGPDTSPQGAVRDGEGKIVGVKGFQTL